MTSGKEFGVSGEFRVHPAPGAWPMWGGQSIGVMRRSKLLKLLREFGVNPPSSTPAPELRQRLAETLAELNQSRDFLRG